MKSVEIKINNSHYIHITYKEKEWVINETELLLNVLTLFMVNRIIKKRR